MIIDISTLPRQLSTWIDLQAKTEALYRIEWMNGTYHSYTFQIAISIFIQNTCPAITTLERFLT